ncbi:hypothetical protein DFJ58DRAFT_788542 [Suillus subalutaceus]|uniref:uncharacterized protein n=1 Tax=Suillus subalutaceus TaxID=48586 RepID=UPI001B875021|nr:uncharacterized protein DFJ58DRAFT_788542 [Suillus subalutaceus]KAG1854178.1 hypothetical protein DFJ58DRAFT_788542 [Suillus subalutaceus]
MFVVVRKVFIGGELGRLAFLALALLAVIEALREEFDFFKHYLTAVHWMPRQAALRCTGASAVDHKGGAVGLCNLLS